MDALALHDIRKAFGAAHVLRGVSLAVEPGEFLAVVGPSGCGKSTLLRIIAGLDRQDGGEMHLGGTPIDGLAPKARDVAMVFQSYALYPHMTVAQNIALPLVMRELTRLERLPGARLLSGRVAAKRSALHAAAARAAALVDLGAFMERKPKELSGGQRQRVALARALVREPRLFLLDEPLSNLDAALRAHTRAELVGLQRRLGVTTLYVTHDQVEAMTMAARIAVMMDGEIVQLGTPREIYDRPADRRVAQFIGTPRMNLMPGRIEAGILLVSGTPLARCSGAAGPVVIGLRPEHARVMPGAPLSGLVQHVEFLGAEAHIHVAIGQGTVIARVTPQERIIAGDRIGIAADPACLHVFAPDGGRLDLACAPFDAVAEAAE